VKDDNMYDMKNNTEYKKIKSKLIFCIILVIFSIYFSCILFYKNSNKVSLRDKEFTTVIGTIKSFRNNPRDFEIEIIEDNIVYRIVTVYKSGFEKDSFEENVKIGDKIEIICSDYMGKTIFENNKVTQTSVYSVKVNGKYYLTLETSFRINEKDSGNDLSRFIVLAFSIYAIGCCVYFAYKLYKVKALIKIE
jgi:hypothetical protein